MGRNKNARQVNYYLKRRVHQEGNSQYWLFVGEAQPYLIQKKEAGWYACTVYHQTLRDAIIYCLYGV